MEAGATPEAGERGPEKRPRQPDHRSSRIPQKAAEALDRALFRGFFGFLGFDGALASNDKASAIYLQPSIRA